MGRHAMKLGRCLSKRVAQAATLAVAVLLVGGCAGPLSTLDPAGPSAQSLAQLWYFILVFTSVIFVLMFAVLLAAALRPEWVRRFTPRQLIVWGGLVMPTVGLVALVGFAVYLGEQLIPRADAGDVVSIEVTARKWHWDFRYPEAPDGIEATSRHVLHIPADREIHLSITSEDVIHSFWVPRLAGKIDAIPGHVNVLRLQADVPGIYAGVCAEYCGVGHAPMVFTVEAHAPEDYEAAIRALAEAGGS
jgi:cytochrome c oxidase subunit II